MTNNKTNDLETESLNLIESLQTLLLENEKEDTKKRENIEDQLINMWKSIPLNTLDISEADIEIGNTDYPHSEETVLYLIVYYLLENSMNDILDLLMKEYQGEAQTIWKLKNDYNQLKFILKNLEKNNFEYIEAFIKEKCKGTTLEMRFSLHKFLIAIDENNIKKALELCSNEICNFLPYKICEIKKILTLLVNPAAIKQQLEISKNFLIDEFKTTYWKVNDMANKSFLEEIFETGTKAFKQLSKAGNLFYEKGDTILPIEIKLDRNKNYHSLFVCPVLKTLSMDDNGPVLLECGHVISIIAAGELSKKGTIKSFKCPYCPEMSRYDKILELRL